MTTKIIIICSLCIALFALYSCHSYRVVNESKSDNYYFNFFKTKVHYIPMGNWFELGNNRIDSADVKTVEVLGRNYMKDKSHVYFKSILIDRADVHSFQMLCSGNHSYAIDKNRIYYESNSFQGINVDSFSFQGTCGALIKDNDHVYSIFTVKNKEEGNSIILPIPGVHAEKYQYLNDWYGKDETHVYYKGYPLVDAEAKTFFLMDEYYAKDANTVYYNGLKIQGLDANTFVLVDGGGYSKDKNGVYFGLDANNNQLGEATQYIARALVGADPKSFEMIKSDKIDYAKDKTNYYWGGKAEPLHK